MDNLNIANDFYSPLDYSQIGVLPDFFLQNYSQPKESEHYSGNSFVSKMSNIYSDILADKGIDQRYVKWLVAQDALESGFGKHIAGKNNLGGRKGKGTILWTTEVVNGVSQKVKQEFKDYDSIEDYALEHVNLLLGSRYQAFNGDFANRVASGGYASDLSYKNKLTRIYNEI